MGSRKAKLFGLLAISLVMGLFLSAFTGYDNRSEAALAVIHHPADPDMDRKKFSDQELIKKVPGFKNGYKKVNGVTLHYVEGGKGKPLFLLPGWPQNWYAYHKIMPELAKNYHVYVVEYRGMGSSDKPPTGYDKKTLSSDIHALVKELGYDKVHMVGHDIGAQVAYAYAAQYPEATTKLVMMDVPHPFEGFLNIPLVAPPGVYDMSPGERPIYPWWFALNSVPELPEQLLQGKQMSIFQDWLFHYLAYGKPPMTQETKDIYYAAYASADAIRASNGWYSTFRQDIDDLKSYKKLSVPALGIAGWDSTGHTLEEFLKQNAADMKMVKINKAGHWIAEQSPQETVKLLKEFFG
ncbi:alpha/beta fold hydrolase [Paenibacillus sp. CF384]|uniref:alpha/beta fold hydrolase n=1 Tax=Paenibacillus sp. CF384 TaxID=1884382 RepID=UPI00089D77C6|nr:alpha/beta hydrolase [Paenibacillus sp. CF384]SDX70547.1 Pimeloyl-ACP methyl ester carboxylesterase [Paenibacillus sp. CF384]